jgi:hypothetical protein
MGHPSLTVVITLLLIAAVATSCGSSTVGHGDKATTMPAVTGQTLDDAKSAIKNAGVDDEVKVDGGGLFGVVVESNWEVCEQNPAAGTTVAAKPTLTVARSCVDNKTTDEPKTTPSETAPTTQETAPAEPQTVATLTRQNNKDLAAILVEDDSCDYKNVAFAKKYAGQTIAFDGSILDIAPAAQKTRHYILIGPGDKDPTTANGPNFQYRDVNMFDLHREDGSHTSTRARSFGSSPRSASTTRTSACSSSSPSRPSLDEAAALESRLRKSAGLQLRRGP